MNDAIYNLMCVAAGILCGAVMWRGDRMESKTNNSRLDRLTRAICDLDLWCGHASPHARLIAGHLWAIASGEGLNAGTPCGSEPCTISGLREQLRRIDAERAAHAEELEGLEMLMADTEWLKAELKVRMEREEQRSTDPRPAMPALQSVGVAAELAVARQTVRAEQAG